MENSAAPIPSTPPQPAVQPTSSPAESSSHRWFLWSAGGLTFLTLGIAIGVFSAKFFNQSTTQSQISSYEDCLAAKGSIVQYSYPATCVTATGQRFVQPLTDEEKQGLQPPDPYREPASSAATATWKTYTNSVYKFSFKYPSAWILSEKEENNENMLVIDLYGEGISSTDQYQANNLLIRVLPAAKQPTEQVCFPRKTSPECFSVSQAQSATVNNISGYLIDYFIPVPGGVSKTDKVRLILVESNGYIYSISQQRIISKEKEFLSAFDQILSTFKFTD